MAPRRRTNKSNKKTHKSARTSTGKSRHKSSKDRRREARETRDSGASYAWLDGDFKMWKPKKGMNHIRIIPYEVSIEDHKHADQDELYWEKMVYVNYNMGAEEISVVPDMAASKHLKAHVQELIREGVLDEDDEKDFWAKKRMIYNILDLDGDDPDEVLLWEYSHFLFQKLLDTECDEDEAFDAYTDLENGFSIKVRFAEESNDGYSFLKADKISFEEAEDLDDSILDDVHDLDVIISYTNKDDLMKLVDEDPEDDVQDEPDDEPEPPKSKRRRRSSNKEEPEDQCAIPGLTKAIMEVGAKLVVEYEKEEWDCVITSNQPNGTTVQVMFEGEEETDNIEVSTILEYTAPVTEEPRRRRRSKKN